MRLTSSDPATYAHETRSILARTAALCRKLRGGCEVLAAFAGMRLSREGGARVERADAPEDGAGSRRVVIYNYGAGGTGFQAGYGLATDAVDAVADVLRDLQAEGRTRL